MNNLLTLQEVKSFLDAEQAELEHYIKLGKLRAYRIGGTYLRFRKEEVLSLRSDMSSQKKNPGLSRFSFFSRVKDFWRFNNFYIVSLLVVLALVFLIFKT